MASNGTETLELEYGALTVEIKMSHRAFAAATHMLKANRLTMFLALRFGSRDSFLDSVTKHVITVAVWDGKEYFLSSGKGVESVA